MRWGLLMLAITLTGAGGDPYEAERNRMLQSHLAGRDIVDAAVLGAMKRVRRELFVPPDRVDSAYADHPLPIGHGQTISQPYIVALMTQLVRPRPGMKALDVGTGSGYQAAVLAEIVGRVYSIEIVCPLANEARGRLKRLGYQNVEVRCGDGWAGWAEAAPFDLIVLAAAPPKEVPPALVAQLAPGGRLVLPVGDGVQKLVVVEKGADGQIRRTEHGDVRFVPMTGEAQK